MSEPLIHAGCGGAVCWDLSGWWCTACHAENLEPDEMEPERDRPGEAGRSAFSSLHENRST
jgi:hypothetical protein